MAKTTKPSRGNYRGSQSGMRKLMKTNPVLQMVRASAEEIRAAADAFDHGRFRVVTYEQSVSTHAFVFPADPHARNSQAKYDILQKSLYT